MDVYGIQLRQPLAWDLIGRKVAIAALGTAFEASYGWVIRASTAIRGSRCFGCCC